MAANEKTYNLDDIMLENDEQKARIKALSEITTLVPKADMLKFIVETTALTLDEKEELIGHIDEMYMSETERALNLIKKQKDEEAKLRREARLKELGHGAKVAVSGANKAKNVTLRVSGSILGGLVKGIANPFIKGWEEA